MLEVIPNLDLNFENNVNWIPGLDLVNETNGFEGSHKPEESGRDKQNQRIIEFDFILQVS